MPEGQVLEFAGVSKSFGGVTAVDGFTARVEPGNVTGFLGPNGAGKTTTLRILLGLVRASEGRATIGGVPYSQLRDPLRTVGAVLEASSFHPGRTGANHLKVYAHAAGLPDSRVDEVLGTVGLADVGGRKVGGYSLGMRQRLGLAYALLGDPGVLVLDEPTNGLDPEGIKWMRGLLRELARQGRTVLISSHLLAEVQQTVDSLVIISRGRLVFQGSLGDLIDPSEYATVVDSEDRSGLATTLRAAGIETEVLRSGLVVRGVDTATVGAAAAANGVALTLLQRRGPALEEIFLDLVNGARVHASASGVSTAAPVEAAEPDESVVAEVDESTVSPDEAVGPTAVADSEPEVTSEAAEDAVVDEAPVVEEAAVLEEAVAYEPVPTAQDHGADAGFVVASTGIIDVVPSSTAPSESDAGNAPPEPASPDTSEHGVFSVGSTGETVETAAIGVISEESPVDESDDHSDGHAGDDGGAEASDRSWETYVKTDSDHEADRFFAAFTDSDVAPESGSGVEGADDITPTPVEGADDGHADEREGGEHR